MKNKYLALIISLAMILSLLAGGMVFAEDAAAENVPDTVQAAEEEKAEEPAAPVEEEKAEEPAAPAEEEKAEEPAAPAEEEKAEEPAAPAEEEKAEDPAAPAEEEKTEEPAAPAEEEKTEEPAAPAEEQQPEAAPVVPADPVEGEVEATNPDGSAIGGNNSAVEAPVAPAEPTCSCGTNEGEAHEEGCPMYEAPAEAEAPAAPEAPADGCTCGAEEGKDHDVDCPVFLATINRLNAVKHSALYMKIMACETESDVMFIVENVTEEEIMELSEEEMDEINALLEAFADARAAEPELPEGVYTEDEVVESEIIVVLDEESENAVAAPFLPPVKG